MQVGESFATPETVPFWQLSSYIELAENAGLAAAGYRLQYYQLLAQPFYLVAMVLLAAAVSLRFFRFGGVQKMVLGGIGAGFLLYVLAKITGDLSKAGLMPPLAAAALPPAVGGLTGADRAALPGGRVMAPPVRHRPLRRAAAPAAASPLALALAALVLGADRRRMPPAPAQQGMLTFPPRPKPAARQQRSPAPGQQMLVRADEINYDYTNERVSAVGNVQIYYGGSTLEADRVIYDQKTKRLHAEGNVRLTERRRHGHLRRDHRSQRRLSATASSIRCASTRPSRPASPPRRAERSSGNFTVFQNGVYTACEPCKDDPQKPPKWQVKAARIIHDQGEKMMYFEDARLEFFGVPIAYMPYFSAPDPTVKRKSGLLVPTFSTSTALRRRPSPSPTTWRWRPTTTSPSRR